MPGMSDFFGALNAGNVRFTDARINGDGPLPTSLSGPEGINGDPDGRYNFNDSLLSSLAPYAGPKEGRMGSDRNYQQIPHRKQYPVPMIYLPEPAWDTSATFAMSHPIDMGDLVFIVNMHYKHYVLTGVQQSVPDAQNNTMPNYNVFCNICTVNYLLAGIHNYTMHFIEPVLEPTKNQHAWYQLMRCLSLDEYLQTIRTRYRAYTNGLPANDPLLTTYKSEILLMVKLMLQTLIRDNIKPLGICSTSEKQGGQHETGYKPVQAAASFFVTLTVDGQNRDLVNIWRGGDVEGGDLLLVQLQYKENTASGNNQITQSYTLNHYYKSFVQRSLQMHQSVIGLFQLVPGVLRTAFEPENKTNKRLADENYKKLQDNWMRHASRDRRGVFACNFNLPNQDADYKDDPEQNKIVLAMLDSVMDNRNLGYWHIGQVYNMQTKFAAGTVPTDDMEMTRGQLLQVNFAPVWHGRVIGEMEMITKRIFTQDAAIRRFLLNLHLDNLSEWLLETRTESSVWFDLTMWALQMSSAAADLAIVVRIGRFITRHLAGLPAHRAFVVGAGGRPVPNLPLHTGGNAAMSLVDELEDPAEPADLSGTAGAAGAAAGAGEISADEAPAKRFKKSAPEAAPEAAAVAPAASSSTAAPADASGWDFEKDLADIFAQTPGEKPRGKAKAKGAQ
jgi:hypothetical protein